MIRTYGGASVELHNFQHYVYLEGLRTCHSCRRKGDATRLLKTLTRWARRYKLRLVLFVGPFNDMPMGVEALEKFYEKVGFRKIEKFDAPFAVDRTWMEYDPCT